MPPGSASGAFPGAPGEARRLRFGRGRRGGSPGGVRVRVREGMTTCRRARSASVSYVEIADGGSGTPPGAVATRRPPGCWRGGERGALDGEVGGRAGAARRGGARARPRERLGSASPIRAKNISKMMRGEGRATSARARRAERTDARPTRERRRTRRRRRRARAPRAARCPVAGNARGEGGGIAGPPKKLPRARLRHDLLRRISTTREGFGTVSQTDAEKPRKRARRLSRNNDSDGSNPPNPGSGPRRAPFERDRVDPESERSATDASIGGRRVKPRGPRRWTAGREVLPSSATAPSVPARAGSPPHSAPPASSHRWRPKRCPLPPSAARSSSRRARGPRSPASPRAPGSPGPISPRPPCRDRRRRREKSSSASALS